MTSIHLTLTLALLMMVKQPPPGVTVTLLVPTHNQESVQAFYISISEGTCALREKACDKKD